MKEVRKRALEGYLYCVPYVGDRWVITAEDYGKPPKNFEEFWEWGEALLKNGQLISRLFDTLEGKKVRITVEVMEEGERK